MSRWKVHDGPRFQNIVLRDDKNGNISDYSLQDEI